MVLSKNAGKNPRELAEDIVSKLKNNVELRVVVDTEKIEIAGPGFINFWIREEYLSLAMGMATSDYWGKSDFMKGKKVLVEYSSPNIAKRFSVGHLRSTIIGQAIFNLYKASGAIVTNDNHLGDWGTQFGMIIAAVEEENLDVSNMNIGGLEELYIRFNTRITENPDLKDKAREAFARLEQGDANARKIWQLAVDVSMKEFEDIYKKLDVSFENMNGESIYEKEMPEIISELKIKKIATEGERGAWIIKFEKDGKEYMPPAMLLKSDGTTTYLTRDLATIQKRFFDDKLKSDIYVYEVGAEQQLHFRQVFETAKMLWPKETEEVEFVHVAHGLLTLPEGKMSTRKGNTIKLEDLIVKAGDEAREFVKNDEVDVDRMAINAIKYNELRRSPELNYLFRWEEALAMEGNSAPYVNYAYVRANKICQELKESRTQELEMLFEGEEKDLARLLMKFAEGEVVEEAAKNFAPHLLAGYLFEVAKRFNAFYDHNKVIGDEREISRLQLVKTVAEVLKKGMGLLGIEVVEKM
jgi:arginyl-tRNA synthetase